VSDRLVTVRDQEWDAFANKALVFAADDALVAIGYSGLAYIGGRPTDERIAEWLAGEPILDRGIGIGSTRTDDRYLWNALARVRDGITRAVQNMTSPERQAGLVICVAGTVYRPKGGGPRPALARIEWHGGHHEPEIQMVGDDRRGPGEYLQVAGGVTRAEQDRVFAEIARATNRREVEDVFAESIRRLSVSSSTIGDSVMCINLTPWNDDCHFGLRFVPGDQSIAHRNEPEIARSGGGTHTVGAYEPWIIGPGGYVPPSMVTHASVERSGVTEFNGLRWSSDHELPVIDPAPDADGWEEVVVFTSQPRPRPPR
jgi:hypothetical protein